MEEEIVSETSPSRLSSDSPTSPSQLIQNNIPEMSMFCSERQHNNDEDNNSANDPLPPVDLSNMGQTIRALFSIMTEFRSDILSIVQENESLLQQSVSRVVRMSRHVIYNNSKLSSFVPDIHSSPVRTEVLPTCQNSATQKPAMQHQATQTDHTDNRLITSTERDTAPEVRPQMQPKRQPRSDHFVAV